MSKRSRRTVPGEASGRPAAPGNATAPSGKSVSGGAGRDVPQPVGGSGAAGTSGSATRPASSGTGPVSGAFGSRRAGGGEGSASPTGTARAGRRAKATVQQKTFLEKNRSRLIGLAIVLGVGLIATFVFASASQSVYACSIQQDPAGSAAPGSPVMGQLQDDLGHLHEAVGTPLTYTFCPPASGKHYSESGLGPIPPRFYGPDDGAIPQGWIHNLEHGGLVVLYNCARGGCDTSAQDQLRQLATTFPASPVCKIPGGLLSPVIARFDQMKASFAAVVWGRVLFQDKLDVPQMLEFFKNVGETTNPEAQCDPNASGSPSASGNSASPGSSGPAVQPGNTESPVPSGT